MFRTEITDTPEGVLIVANGRLDTVSAVDFEKALSVLKGKNSLNLIIDCSGLSYISSTGLRIFLSLQKEVNVANGRLKILNMSEIIKEIFDMTGLSQLFIFE